MISNTNKLVPRSDLKWLIKKLKVTDNTVLLVKFGTALATKETIDNMAATINRMGLKNVLVFVVDDFDDVQSLDKGVMNRAGWYRLQDFARLGVNKR